MLGGAAGLLVAFGGAKLLVVLDVPRIPRMEDTAFMPARAAMKVDPLVALRHE